MLDNVPSSFSVESRRNLIGGIGDVGNREEGLQGGLWLSHSFAKIRFEEERWKDWALIKDKNLEAKYERFFRKEIGQFCAIKKEVWNFWIWTCIEYSFLKNMYLVAGNDSVQIAARGI